MTPKEAAFYPQGEWGGYGKPPNLGVTCSDVCPRVLTWMAACSFDWAREGLGAGMSVRSWAGRARLGVWRWRGGTTARTMTQVESSGPGVAQRRELPGRRSSLPHDEMTPEASQ